MQVTGFAVHVLCWNDKQEEEREMETIPVSLALFDFIPVAIFFIGAFYLVRIALHLRGSRCGRMAVAGALLIGTGGLLKAIWKLMYAMGVADVRWMSEVQFALVAPGFLALLIVAILIARKQKPKEKYDRFPPASPLLAIAAWKIPLLAVMTLASMGAQGILTYMAFRRGARVAAVGFIVAFLCLVGMGAMASGEQSVAKQWIEESVNTLGQVGFAVGSILLHRNVTRNPGEC
jgi:hypothetical protein